MKSSILKAAVLSTAICATLISCTGKDSNNNESKGNSANNGLNPANFTTIAKDPAELEKLGEKTSDYSGGYTNIDDLKLNSKLSVGMSSLVLNNFLLQNGVSIQQETTTTVLEVSENSMKLKQEYGMTLDGRSGSGSSIMDCEIVGKSETVGDNTVINKKLDCITSESQYNIADMDQLMKKFSNFQSCSINTEGDQKNTSMEVEYGNYKMKDGRIVKATKTIYKSKGKVQCYKDYKDENKTDIGNGESIYVSISSPELINIDYPLYGDTIYMYGETKLEDGQIVSAYSTERLR